MTLKIPYIYGKESEKIISELFIDMGFEVSFIGVEHRRHYIKDLSARDIYSPDLKLYDSDREEYFFVEVKALIITEDKKFVIKSDLLEKYNKYYPKNCFIVLYLPEKSVVGMLLLENLFKYNSYRKEISVDVYNREKHKLEKKRFMIVKFDKFERINFYGKSQVFSFKFCWKTESDMEFDKKIKDFLQKRQYKILPLLNEVKNQLPKKDWTVHNIKKKRKKRRKRQNIKSIEKD